MKFEVGSIAPETVVNYFQASTRITRASNLLENVRLDAPDIYIVQSETSKAKYVTDVRAMTCSCPDWTMRGSITGVPCKHLQACLLKERLQQ